MDSGIPTKDLTLSPRLIKLNLPTPSAGEEEGTHSLSTNDAFLASLLDLLPKQNYTILYTTTRSEDGVLVAQRLEGTDPVDYDMDSQIQESMHLDLKRDLGIHEAAATAANNQTIIDGPLFDKYQFFTPGEAPPLSTCYVHYVQLRSLHYDQFDLISVLTTPHRHLHGLPRRLPSFVDSLRRHFRRGESASYVRGLRQGTRTIRYQEASMSENGHFDFSLGRRKYGQTPPP